jgi:hypothetical protein
VRSESALETIVATAEALRRFSARLSSSFRGKKKEAFMPNVNLPLSGPVAQAFHIWTSLFSAFGNQTGFINVNLGRSSNPAVEAEVLSEVASYGKQLGRIEDALVVLLKHVQLDRLDKNEARAINDLKRMLEDIADVKERRTKNPALRPSREP